MADTTRALEIFMDVQRGLPRQGPGDDESTRRALALCGRLPKGASVLDVGCGPGMQTMVLAFALDAEIEAVDLHEEYLDQLRASLQAEGLDRKAAALRADMNALPFADRSFDLIWSEGAAYVMGFENALSSFRQLLKPGGCVAVTELVWLERDPPAEVAAYFGGEYPAMRHRDDVCRLVERLGYELLGHFTLPNAAWWEHYYGPLEAKLPALRAKYEGDAEALAIVTMTEREIAMRHQYPDAYGYEFVVARV